MQPVQLVANQSHWGLMASLHDKRVSWGFIVCVLQFNVCVLQAHVNWDGWYCDGV